MAPSSSPTQPIVVAIAGGTGGLGRAIVDAHKAVDERVRVVVLARQTTPEKEAEIGATILAVDFTDVDALTRVLEDSKINTVISAVGGMAGPEPDLALIKATQRAGVKRFIPSSWGVEHTSKTAQYFALAEGKIAVRRALEASSSLEWTSVSTGFFSDYLCFPKVPSYTSPFPLIFDIPNAAAVIPGSGDVPVAFTHTSDIATYVARLVLAPAGTWTHESTVVGDRITPNELLRLAEDARSVKFTVTRDSLELLKRGESTALPAHVAMYPFFPKEAMQPLMAAFGRLVAEGYLNVQPAQGTSLNERFPDVRPRSVNELIDAAWRE